MGTSTVCCQSDGAWSAGVGELTDSAAEQHTGGLCVWLSAGLLVCVVWSVNTVVFPPTMTSLCEDQKSAHSDINNYLWN